LGLTSSRRLELIERNRILLAVKLFPWSLLWLNGAYYMARVGAGLVASSRGRGEIGRFPGWRGKCRAGMALVKGDLAALLLLPRMLAKRRKLEKLRKLSPRQVRQLILHYRISLRELTENAA
jgi:hypothetical protein